MFELKSSFNIGNISSFSDGYSSSLKLVKFLDDNTIIIVENTSDSYYFYKISINGDILYKWEYNSEEDVLLDYIYLNDTLYIAMYIQFSSYEEQVVLYKSYGNSFDFIASFPRASYLHDMDYFYMFNKNNQLRMLVIRHTRLYLYTIDENNPFVEQGLTDGYEQFIELAYLEGYRWIINNGYAINIKDDVWELYDTNLKLIKSFNFDSSIIDWLGISLSNDGSIIAIACDSSDSDKGLLCVYDVVNDEISTHTQRYGYFSVGIINNKVYTSIVSSKTDIGGIMIFDKKANLKYAHIKDEKEANPRQYNPSPLFYQALAIEELRNGKGLISTENKFYITDLSCRIIQEIQFVPYECFSVNSKRNRLALLIIDGKKHESIHEKKYNANIEIYEWSSKENKANILDLKAFRNE